MKKETALLFYYRPANKHSMIALAGAVADYYPECDLYFAVDRKQMLQICLEQSSKYKRLVMAVSMFSSQYWETAADMRFFKDHLPENIVYIIGGPHVTGAPESVLDLGFKIAVIGEGEECILEILDALNNNQEFSSIKGIAYKQGEKTIVTEARPAANLDKFTPFNLKHHKIGPLEISRGCIFGCNYCQTPRIFGHKLRHRSLDKILGYVDDLNRIPFKDIRFTTPNAFSYGSSTKQRINYSALEELFTGIKRINPKLKLFIGSFPSEVRPDFVNEETIRLLKTYAANDNLVIGAQTGSDKLLKSTSRGHNVDSVLNATELTLKAGFKAYVDMIVGLPGETKEDVVQSVSVMQKLVKMGAKIHLHTFMPLIQTPFQNEAAGEVHEAYLPFINKYIATGAVYGNWEKHKELAKRFENEFKQR